MNRIQPWTILVIVAALGGLFFSSYSTYDFVAHLDRQVHGIHCSFLPGLDETDVTGNTGCHTTLMSPYSSVLRASMWGGLPVALPAMGVFAFLMFFAGALPILGRERDPRATLFLMLGTLLPVLTSAVMAYVSLVTLDAACKLCIGIYVSSGLAMLGATMLWLRARKAERAEQTMVGWGGLAGAFAVGVAFVFVPSGVYAAAAPDFDRYIGECGALTEMPSEGMLVPLGPQDHEVGVVEVFDPLCPACRGFEQRFDAQSASADVSRQVLLFPLDDACNWMIDDAIHAGACAISEAILCADEDSSVSPQEVIDWAFAEQEEIRLATEAEPEAAAQRARQRFPALAACIGSPQVQARLNLGLRYAVDNQMPIITPQVFVNGLRMCDEDTDLGMDFALRHLIERAHTDGMRPPAPRRESLAPPPPTKRATISLRPRTEPEEPTELATETDSESESDVDSEADSDSDSDSNTNTDTNTNTDGEDVDTDSDAPVDVPNEPVAPAAATDDVPAQETAEPVEPDPVATEEDVR